MTALDWVSAIAAASTAVGVLLAWSQIRLVQKQSRTQFEDVLTAEYRRLVRSLPVKAMLGKGLDEAELEEHLATFFCYFDLCNEQVFLRQQGRISKATWENWREGIESNLALDAFRQARERVLGEPGKRFAELRALELSRFTLDPVGQRLDPPHRSSRETVPTETTRPAARR